MMTAIIIIVEVTITTRVTSRKIYIPEKMTVDFVNIGHGAIRIEGMDRDILLWIIPC